MHRGRNDDGSNRGEYRGEEQRIPATLGERRDRVRGCGSDENCVGILSSARECLHGGPRAQRRRGLHAVLGEEQTILGNDHRFGVALLLPGDHVTLCDHLLLDRRHGLGRLRRNVSILQDAQLNDGILEGGNALDTGEPVTRDHGRLFVHDRQLANRKKTEGRRSKDDRANGSEKLGPDRQVIEPGIHL